MHNLRLLKEVVMKKQLGMKGVVFTEKQLNEAIENKQLLNIQLAIPCGCLCDCVYCYQASSKTGSQITLKDVKRMIDQMKKLGSIYLQILGHGEPLLNKDFFDIVRYANHNGIYVSLFTCGDVLGDDNIAMKIHGIDGLEVIQRLKKMDISLFIKYELKNQDHIAQRQGYSAIRDRALERLIAAGFNSTTPTRLGITPVILNLNIHELREIYRWALSNNIYPHLCVLIPTGKAKDVSTRNLDISHEELISLTIDNYKEAIDQGYQYTGSTPFPGGVSCEYLRIGLYVDEFGDVFLCSGRDTGSLGNIKHDKLGEIWEKSFDERRPFIHGHGCPWKEQVNTIPPHFYEVVDKAVKEYITLCETKENI